MQPAERFVVRLSTRGYEVDSNGHVAGSVLLQYGQHARWECLRSAGVDQADLLDRGIGVVSLEERIRFHREIRAGEQVEISCAYIWGERKTFRVEQEIRTAAGELAAELTNIGGLLDLEHRRLIAAPGATWRTIAKDPGILGL